MAEAIHVTLGGGEREEADAELPRVDLHEMVKRRARREYRVPIEHTPLSERDGFDDTVVGYSASQAMSEAERCLDCHTICSLCVGVCPNMALMTYESEPFTAALPMLRVDGGQVVAEGHEAYRAEQLLQIAVLTDFCNECGNCVTACPTSGEPYRDKPRLYLDRAEFEAEADNAYMLHADGSVEGRYRGQTHRLSVNGSVEYETPGLRVRLDPTSLALLEADATAGLEAPSLRPAADMLVLVRGLRGSMPQLPLVTAAESSGTRIAHPGYEE